jgi:hypothetical protein
MNSNHNGRWRCLPTCLVYFTIVTSLKSAGSFLRFGCSSEWFVRIVLRSRRSSASAEARHDIWPGLWPVLMRHSVVFVTKDYIVEHRREVSQGGTVILLTWVS